MGIVFIKIKLLSPPLDGGGECFNFRIRTHQNLYDRALGCHKLSDLCLTVWPVKNIKQLMLFLKLEALAR